jgi:hypothetical protein
VEKLTGIQPVSVIAKRLRVSQRAARRTLERVNKDPIVGGRLLVPRTDENQPVLVDCEIANRHIPGLVAGDGMDPLRAHDRWSREDSEEKAIILREVRSTLEEVRDLLHALVSG